MEFEQIQGLLEGLLKMFNNYIWIFLELVVVSGKFNVFGISGVILAILTILGEVSRRKSVPERPSCIGKRVSRRLKENGNNTDSTSGLEQTAEYMPAVFLSQPIFLRPGGYSL
jgi:hypothetical protein